MLTTVAALVSLLTLPPGPPQEPAAPQAPIHVAGGIIAGSILTKVQPIFPPFPPETHLSGATVLHAIIGKDGHVKTLSIISGPEVLRAGMLDAVRQWTYRPYLLHGEPVEVDTTITINITFGAPPTPAPAAESEAPIRVPGGVMAGTVLNKVMPLYPEEARNQHVTGTVVLHVIIGKDGHVKDASAISGPELLRAADIDAVRQWTYKPYLLNGEATEVDTTVVIENHATALE